VRKNSQKPKWNVVNIHLVKTAPIFSGFYVPQGLKLYRLKSPETVCRKVESASNETALLYNALDPKTSTWYSSSLESNCRP